MNVIANKDNICIRKMEESRDDFELFLKWMTDPDTMKYWEGMNEHFTYDRVVKGYKEGNEAVSYTHLTLPTTERV